MNRLSRLTTLWLVLATGAMSAIGEFGSPVQVFIQTRKLTFSRGGEIRLGITLTNVSDRPVEIYTADGANGGEAENDYAIYMRDSSGHLLPRIDGRAVVRSDGKVVRMRGGTPGRQRVIVQPGEGFQDFTLLNRLFDLTNPGVYTISIARDIQLDHASPRPALATATSNTIQINVVNSGG